MKDPSCPQTPFVSELLRAILQDFVHGIDVVIVIHQGIAGTATKRECPVGRFVLLDVNSHGPIFVVSTGFANGPVD